MKTTFSTITSGTITRTTLSTILTRNAFTRFGLALACAAVFALPALPTHAQQASSTSIFQNSMFQNSDYSAPPDEEVPTGPLDPSDPRAILDPALRNVPPLPVPQRTAPQTATARRSKLSARQEALVRQEAAGVTYEVSTGRSLLERAPLAIFGAQPGEAHSGNIGQVGGAAFFGSVPHFQGEPLVPPADAGKGQSSQQGQAGERGSLATRGHKTIFGSDDRTRIYSTSAYPWRTNCKLYMAFPDGQNFIASATMINARYAITAGHCVYDSAHGGWARSIQVVPGLSGSYMPYGSAYVSYMHSFSGWTNSGNSDYDVALLRLDRNIGNTTGWLGWSSSSPQDFTGNLSGYPGDRDNGLGQYYSWGSFSHPWSFWPFSHNSDQVQTYVDWMPGESGTGIYQYLNGNRTVLAVVSHHSDMNYGTTLAGGKGNLIYAWMANNQ